MWLDLARRVGWRLRHLVDGAMQAYRQAATAGEHGRVVFLPAGGVHRGAFHEHAAGEVAHLLAPVVCQFFDDLERSMGVARYCLDHVDVTIAGKMAEHRAAGARMGGNRDPHLRARVMRQRGEDAERTILTPSDRFPHGWVPVLGEIRHALTRHVGGTRQAQIRGRRALARLKCEARARHVRP